MHAFRGMKCARDIVETCRLYHTLSQEGSNVYRSVKHGYPSKYANFCESTNISSLDNFLKQLPLYEYVPSLAKNYYRTAGYMCMHACKYNLLFVQCVIQSSLDLQILSNSIPTHSVYIFNGSAQGFFSELAAGNFL